MVGGLRRIFFSFMESCFGVASYSEHVLIFMVMYLKAAAVYQEYLCLLRNTCHSLETPLAVSEYRHWATVVIFSQR